MKLLVPLSCMFAAIAACGFRTSMDTCAEGTEHCSCLAGACHPGLICIENACVRPGTVPTRSGGAASSGGVVASGGQGGSGGQMASGGQIASGGIGSGGSRAGSGGRIGSGGIMVSGGIVGSGGYAGSGGRIGVGGVSGMSGGGRSGFGGSTQIINFMNGQATGMMDGWGWAALGPNDALYSPTCAGQPITASTACTTMTSWSSSTGLCIVGMIPALPARPSASDYNDNWGIMVAAECRDPPAPLGNAFRTIWIQVDGSPTTGLRALVHRWGDPDTTNYCANMANNTAMSFTAFNTACWDGSGTPLTLDDVPNLDWIGIQVPSSQSAIKVNLCLGAIFLIP